MTLHPVSCKREVLQRSVGGFGTNQLCRPILRVILGSQLSGTFLKFSFRLTDRTAKNPSANGTHHDHATTEMPWISSL
jgi:hypothetical protein